jgi:hypothetical protein
MIICLYNLYKSKRILKNKIIKYQKEQQRIAEENELGNNDDVICFHF